MLEARDVLIETKNNNKYNVLYSYLAYMSLRYSFIFLFDEQL